MKTSEFCFKAAGTCVVLIIAMWLVGWAIQVAELVILIYVIGAIGLIALVIGIISLIWE